MYPSLTASFFPCVATPDVLLLWHAAVKPAFVPEDVICDPVREAAGLWSIGIVSNQCKRPGFFRHFGPR